MNLMLAVMEALLMVVQMRDTSSTCTTHRIQQKKLILPEQILGLTILWR